MKNYKLMTTGLVGITACSGLALTSIYTYADDSAVDTTTITVPVSCTMSGNIATGQEHSATLQPGTYSGASGSDYENGIGKTTLTTFCNDDNGFSIYAVGFTGDTMEGENHTKLVGTSASNNATIPTKVYESSDTASNWSMKVTKVDNSTQSYNPQNMTITNSFNNWHIVPDTYTKVAEYKATTGTSTTDTTLGAKVETTYAAYVSTSQPADTYTGKVKYTMVHPYIFIPDRLNVTYNANGLAFANGEATNYMAYDAISSASTETITEHSRSVYNEDGTYNGYAAPGGNSVVTIPNASSIHIEVTIGVPQTNSGPPSDLYIWSGSHPDYTYIDNTTSLTSCGTATATDGAFHSTGSPGSQITIECDIVGDSVTFYDYSISTNGSVSTGYYATITNVGDIISYTKNSISGTYSTPIGAPGTYVFYGWSENPNATSPAYESEADIISKAPYTNQDGDVTLYAIWLRPSIMQSLDSSACTTTPTPVVDIRDNQIYTIARLKDGQCWMTENLDIAGGTALSSTDTDFDASYDLPTTNNWTVMDGKLILPASSTEGFSQNYNYAYLYNSNNKSKSCDNEPCYSYYSWDAATLGSGVDITTSDEDAPYSICPKGWKLPNSRSTISGNSDFYKLAVAYGMDSSRTNGGAEFNTNAGPNTRPEFLLGGYYYSSNSFSGGGSSGYYWSSTSHGQYSADVFQFDNMYVYTTGANSTTRRFGCSVRCLLRN